MKLEIESMLTCSTGHITEQDSKMLTEFATEFASGVREIGWHVSLYPYDEGWFIWTGGDTVHYDSLSEHANKLVALARENRCTWLRLDRDGDTIEGLPIFDW